VHRGRGQRRVIARSVFALAVAAGPATSSPAAATAPRVATLQRRIDAILDVPALASGWWGVEIRDVTTGRVVYARNAMRNVKPASTLKILATAAALDAFGPDHRFRTTVETAGRIDGEGRVVGDVYLVGGGDPNISGRFNGGRATAALEELADQLRAAGVRRVEGRIVAHEGLFAGERRGEDWSWGDLVWCYGAEVSALSFNDNCVDLEVAPAEREGEVVVVKSSPPSAYYRVEATAITSARGTPGELRLERDLGGNVIRISGTHALGQAPWRGSVALEDPARYAGTVFREVLAGKGIETSGDVVTTSAALPAGRRVLASMESDRLSEIVKTVNKESQNLHTEMLLRHVGARRGGVGTMETGREAVEEFLLRLGVEPERWSLRDASGLSRSDLVSPHEMVSLLMAMDRHPHAAFFRDSLPLAGVDGTLENRMRGTLAEGRVQAKTGTIRNVNALAGYVTTRRGQRLAFYAAINHHTAEGSEAVAALDAMMALLAGS
jgi:D-alanyl-D-alanine carboxypeptidase/D-alanyl-D-alanine-endopeptidase (penicillin-binding protein 4)